MGKNEKPILVRVDTDLFAKIEAKRGEKHRDVFIGEILTRYLKNIRDTNIDTQSNTHRYY